MEILLWIVGIHLLELLLLGCFLLYRKNYKLEKIVQIQQQHIEAIGIVISDSEQRLTELDRLGALKADDEVGVFFQNLQQIQTILNQFNTNK